MNENEPYVDIKDYERIMSQGNRDDLNRIFEYEIMKFKEKNIAEGIIKVGNEYAKAINPKLKNQKIDPENIRIQLGTCYEKIVRILKDYVDINEDFYDLISIWIIGTYMHKAFKTYPYLFFNAMRGSGKTRILKLVTHLSERGQLLNSPTEAVLFRSEGTIGIDEFEGITRRGSENIRELLNSAYKKGTKVKRVKKVIEKGEEKRKIEEFEVYRPVVMANIWGMEEVLGDRCITLVVEKSIRPDIIRKIEDFEENDEIKDVLNTLNLIKCSLCSVVVTENVYRDWNNYLNSIKNKNLNYTNSLTTNNTNYTNNIHLFNKLYASNIDGRHLELTISLLLISNYISNELFDKMLSIIQKIIIAKKNEEFSESRDISLIDFISQYPIRNYISINRLTREFKDFLHEDETEMKWINPKWMGRALKRLSLIIEKRRLSYGIEVIVDVEKALKKIENFKLK